MINIPCEFQLALSIFIRNIRVFGNEIRNTLAVYETASIYNKPSCGRQLTPNEDY